MPRLVNHYHIGILALLAVTFGLTGLARAHCDTLDGPVVKEARLALERGDVTPVLKWVSKANEEELKLAFHQVLTVRAQSAAAKALADRYFFETLVRLHRAGEGAPYTGLKPAGTEVPPAIAAADQALATGAVEPLINLITKDVAEGLHRHLAEASEKQRHAGESVAAGREYVAAYVTFVHYALGIHAAAGGPAGDEEAEAHGHAAPAPAHAPAAAAPAPHHGHVPEK